MKALRIWTIVLSSIALFLLMVTVVIDLYNLMIETPAYVFGYFIGLVASASPLILAIILAAKTANKEK